MLKRSNQKVNVMREPQHIDTLIGVHSVFIGNLTFEGAVRIDGRFEGDIKSSKEGTLIVSEGALIKGEVHVPNLVLHGDINGDVFATNSLKVGPQGVLNGDVEYKTIVLAEGSSVNGRCARITEAGGTKAKPDDVPVIEVK